MLTRHKSSSFFRFSKRSHFTADAARGAQTEVVLLHAGQPWNEFHAREFLKLRSASRFRAPAFVHNTLASTKLLNSHLPKCMAAYKTRESLETQVDGLAEHLKSSLESVLPEHAPFRVSRCFQYDEKPFSEKFAEIQANRSQKLVFFPLYPHFSREDGGILLAESAKIIESSSSPMIRANKEILSSRIEQNSDYSYDVTAIWRWDNHSILADYWSSKLGEHLADIDAVVFAAPRKFACDSAPIHATCQRTMSQLGDLVPWRIGFYNSWAQLDIPLINGLKSQIKKFEGKDRKVAIVPISEVVESFDTFYTIPKEISDLKNTLILNPDSKSEKLVHGIAELVKNRLLGRQDRQLEVAACRRQLDALRIFWQ